MRDRVFTQLLGTTIQHIEYLRDQEVRSARVSVSTLATLCRSTSASEEVAPDTKIGTEIGGAKLPPPPCSNHSMLLPTPRRWEAANLEPAAKQTALQQLRSRALGCRLCPHLASSRKNVVFGSGSLESEVLFVGEAPGSEEDMTGQPFIGKAGELLTKIIHAMGLSRETVFIANILKCRPDTPGQLSGNRKPSPLEMATCIPYLEEQISIIRPKVMVALGSTAIEGLLRKAPVHVTRIRGQWLQFHDIPLMPTYHPAYLLRSNSMSEKRKVWEDMISVMERIGLPISQKQRNYFLKPS
jgi:uracil-DNA glycosylase family 4